MNTLRPRLAVVSSHNICCAISFYADALKDFLHPAFDVEIIDLKTSQLLRQEGDYYLKASEAYIDQICEKLKEFDIVNVHLELGLYGTAIDLITSRILRLCQASGRLILTVHTIDYKGPNTDHGRAYEQIIDSLKKRPASNPFHLIVHLRQECARIKDFYKINHVSDFPLIYLTNERRNYFKQKRNPAIWKKQFGLKDEDTTLGMFGLISAHKNYLHALRTLNLLPAHFKLLVIGEAHHMNIKEWQVDPVIQEMVTYLDQRPELANRVIFTGKREDEKYYEDLANIDFVLLPSFEVGQTGSATLSAALELAVPVLKSNISNTAGYATYFPNCFETFDVGNFYETKHKILNFNRTKIENLNEKIELFSEVQIRQMYLDIYHRMKASAPVELSSELPAGFNSAIPCISLSESRIRKMFKQLPLPAQTLLRKIKKLAN